MIKPVMQTIYDQIQAADQLMIFRHHRPDGDCVGATKGLREIIRATWPDKRVLLVDPEHSDYLAFLGPDDDEVSEDVYARSLGIVLDTATSDRISNPRFRLCRHLIKIDHHIEVEAYGDINWVEEERSSACEMVAAFFDAFRDRLRITRQAATFIYTGMVTDSGRFQYEGVTGDTLRLAGLMLDQGVDTKRLYAQLYLQSFDMLKFKAYVYQSMCMSENGVASIAISRAVQEQFGLTFENACTVIGYLDGIRGCLCWLAFIENPAGEDIRVRLRSRFVAINGLAEKYRGGGHACASGATIYSEAEMDALIRDADALVKQYKETHEDWL